MPPKVADSLWAKILTCPVLYIFREMQIKFCTADTCPSTLLAYDGCRETQRSESLTLLRGVNKFLPERSEYTVRFR